MIIIDSMLYTAYPRQLWISSNIQNEKQFRIEEKSIINNLDYLKEDIKIPQLADGNDKKKINLINNVINNDILHKVEDAEKNSKKFFLDIQYLKMIIYFSVYIMTIMNT